MSSKKDNWNVKVRYWTLRLSKHEEDCETCQMSLGLSPRLRRRNCETLFDILRNLAIAKNCYLMSK